MLKNILLVVLLFSAANAYAACEDQLIGLGVPSEKAVAICNPSGTVAAEDITTSDDLTVGDDLTVTGTATITEHLKLDVGTLAAAGTNLATAGSIVDQMTVVTGCDATKGVALPDAVVGEFYFIHATGTNSCKLYAAGSSTINATAGATGETLALEELAVCFATAADTYFCGVGVDF